MKSLELKIPPVLIFLVAVIGLYNSPKDPALYDFLQGFHFAVAIGVFCVGVTIGLWSVVTFKMAKTTVNPVSVEKASFLVTHGIFKYSRNPMYLAMAICIIGVALYLRVELIMGLFFLFFYIAYMTRFQIVPEEKVLLEKFNEDYQCYLNQTRRWL